MCRGSGREVMGGKASVGQGSSVDCQKGWLSGTARQAKALQHQYGEPVMRQRSLERAKMRLTESVVVFGHCHVFVTISNIECAIALEDILLSSPPAQVSQDEPLDVAPLEGIVLRQVLERKWQDRKRRNDGESVNH